MGEGTSVNTIGSPAAIYTPQNSGSAGNLVMKKAMDTVNQEGQNVLQLLNAPQNLDPYRGKNVDIRA